MKYFICPPDPEGFYSAVFAAYSADDACVTSQNVQQAFGDETIIVDKNAEHASRIRAALVRYGGQKAPNDIAICLRSGRSDRENIAFRYARLILNKRRDVSRFFSHPDAALFNATIDAVRLELHRFTGFLRFSETANGVMYAPYEPDNDITDILAPFFCKRLGKTPFVIHDVKRNRFAMWNGENLCRFSTASPVNIVLSQRENELTALWKDYFDSVNIASRPHPKQQDGYLPRRYRKNMPEFR